MGRASPSLLLLILALGCHAEALDVGTNADSGTNGSTRDAETTPLTNCAVTSASASYVIGGVPCYPATAMPAGSCSNALACTFCSLICPPTMPRQFYTCSCAGLGSWRCALQAEDTTLCPEDASMNETDANAQPDAGGVADAGTTQDASGNNVDGGFGCPSASDVGQACNVQPPFGGPIPGICCSGGAPGTVYCYADGGACPAVP
jgi:hypothetical protein